MFRGKCKNQIMSICSKNKKLWRSKVFEVSFEAGTSELHYSETEDHRDFKFCSCS